MTELTRLVHAAYKHLADLGFRYWGTWQSEEDTRTRCSEGHTLVAESEGRLFGTVTVKQSNDETDPDWYRRPGTWIVTQFAVSPDLQAKGLGSRLLQEAERIAFQNGGTEAAIDTAEGAQHLIEYYAKRGYRHVGRVDWDGTNYVSVIMSKRLRPVLQTTRLVLRDLRLADLDHIEEHWQSKRFQAMYPPGRLTREHLEEVFLPELEGLNVFPRTIYHWAIEYEERMIGTIRLTLERSATGTVGYGFSESEWGKGFATEAVNEILRYGFEELNLARIQAWVFAINTASVRVLEKAGFKYEGTLRQKVDFGTHRIDDHVYGILKSEWNGVPVA